jgi:hypothetical protein
MALGNYRIEPDLMRLCCKDCFEHVKDCQQRCSMGDVLEDKVCSALQRLSVLG